MMLALGFSSGLPFLLVGNTFGYWLRDEAYLAGGHRLSVLGRPRLFAEIPLGAVAGPVRAGAWRCWASAAAGLR